MTDAQISRKIWMDLYSLVSNLVSYFIAAIMDDH